jgi:DNA-binding NarL/FixJ family response regulator
MTDGPARILIVDDEPLNLDYLEQELEALGFVTESALNGVEALQHIAVDPPDLVLLDVMMPELDGISVLETLKSDPETRLIPVVLMTALNAVEDRVRGIEAGADDFLSKPVNDRELLARIRTALATKRAIDETLVELRRTSAHLEQYGRQRREMAVLAVAWRPSGDEVAEGAVGFVARRARASLEKDVDRLGGSVLPGDGALLLAVFDDARVAAEAASLAVRAAPPQLAVGAAVEYGPVEVGSRREGTSWVFDAEGEPVERALGRARSTSGVLVSAEAERGGAATESSRSVRTILVTDIVGSTAIAERLGDRAWAELLANYYDAVLDELHAAGGREVDISGDGLLAWFDTPAPAIRCALALHDRVGSLTVTIRVGLHTGEVEEVDGKPSGIAIHLAARVAERAAEGEVLVSATTRELAAGSGLVFADRGEHVLKGVAETRRLYAAFDDPTAAARVTSERRADAYPAGLTSRQVDVLRLVALGLSDQDVADRLVLSIRTVNAHLRSIYRKLGVSSRAAAGEFARENGLL